MRQKNQFKSKLEIEVSEFLGENAEYEPEYIEWIQPAKGRKYCPDFKTKAGVYIETKGKWDADDRAKHVFLKEQHPDKRIVLLFQNPDVCLNKRSKTSYGMWATKNGLEWYDWRKRTIPEELILENNKNNRNTRRRNGTTRKSIKGGT